MPWPMGFDTNARPPGRANPVSSALGAALAAIVLASCGQEALIRKARQDPGSFLIVDCKLPPQVRNVGLAMTYIAPPQAVKTSAIDCGIRGGEYVAYDRANYATALNVWLAGAEAGNPEAQTNVGEIYEKGLGTPPNYAEAARWYEKAAAKGYPRAQVNLGYLYETGLGVPENPVTALNWYRRASGLSGDLALASTFNAGGQEQAVQAREEAGALRHELAQSRQEVDALRQRLEASQSELENDREKLRQTLKELENTRLQIDTLKNSPPGQQKQNLPQIEQDLKDREARAAQESESIRRLADRYQRQNDELLAQLKAAEQRAASMNSQLDKNRFETARLQTQLAQSEATLETLKLEYQARQSLAGPASGKEEKLRELEARLGERERELKAQQALSAGLEDEVARLGQEKKALEQKAGEHPPAEGQSPDAISRQLAATMEKYRQERDKTVELQQQNAKLAAERERLLAEKNRQAQTEALARQDSALALEKEKRLQTLEGQLGQRERDLQAQMARSSALESEVARLGQEKKLLEQQAGKQAAAKDRGLETISKQLAAAMEKQREEREKTSELERQNAQLTAEKNKLIAAQGETAGRRDERLEKLAQEIAKQEKERARMEAALKAAQAQSARAEPVAKAAADGPRIVLQDPALALTRSIEAPAVNLQESIPTRKLTGIVYAPAGVQSLTVNDQSETVNSAGVFTSEVKLTKKETPVKITLVDKQGRKDTLDFKLVLPSQASAAAGGGGVLPPDVDFGTYHALVIGNNQYTHIPPLTTPVNDATAVSGVLRDKYGFAVTQLNNATRYDILSALNKLRDTLKEKDNLLIYYAGHGELDKVNQQGQWLPVDAERNNTANWIPTDAITALLNQISSKHILVIADSCYSGAMTRASLANLKSGVSTDLKVKWIKKMLENKSRTVLTSGGLAPVLEAGTGNHSVFAQAFIDAMTKNNDIVQGQDLFNMIGSKVKQAAERYRFEQIPQYAPIRYTDHEASDFFFVPKSRG